VSVYFKLRVVRFCLFIIVVFVIVVFLLLLFICLDSTNGKILLGSMDYTLIFSYSVALFFR